MTWNNRQTRQRYGDGAKSAVSFRLPTDLVEYLQEQARATGQSQTLYLARLLRQDRKDKKGTA